MNFAAFSWLKNPFRSSDSDSESDSDSDGESEDGEVVFNPGFSFGLGNAFIRLLKRMLIPTYARYSERKKILLTRITFKPMPEVKPS